MAANHQKYEFRCRNPNYLVYPAQFKMRLDYYENKWGPVNQIEKRQLKLRHDTELSSYKMSVHLWELRLLF